MLTEHLCIIISETEKQKSQKLANLYRQLEFEEAELKEARKDLVAAIAEEARRSSDSSALYAAAAASSQTNQPRSSSSSNLPALSLPSTVASPPVSSPLMPPSTAPIAHSYGGNPPLASNLRSPANPPFQPTVDGTLTKPLFSENSLSPPSSIHSVEMKRAEQTVSEDNQRGLFSAFSWGDVTTTVGGVVTETVNSLIAVGQDDNFENGAPPVSQPSSSHHHHHHHAPVVSSRALPRMEEEDDIKDIPMEELFKGFSAEEVNDLMK